MDRCIPSWTFAFFASLAGALAFLSPFGGRGAAGQSVVRDGAVGPTPVVTGAAPRPGRVRLVYELGPGARGCDDEAFFRRMLRSELEIPDPFEPKGPATHVLTVRIQRDSPGFRAIVRLQTAEGREVFARDYLERSCSDAVDRAVIVAMLAVFPASDRPPPPPAPTGPAAQDSPVDKKVSSLEARSRADQQTIEALQARLAALEKALSREQEKGTKKMDIGWALSAGALMTANLTPDVGPGVWAEGQGRVGPFSLGAELRAALPANVSVSKYNFDQSEYMASLLPCFHYLYFFGCAKIGAGAQVANDSNYLKVPGYVNHPTAASPLFQTGGRLGAEVLFGDTPFGLTAWGELLFSWPYPYFIGFADDAGPHKWVRPELNAYFGLGLVVKLGGDGAR